MQGKEKTKEEDTWVSKGYHVEKKRVPCSKNGEMTVWESIFSKTDMRN